MSLCRELFVAAAPGARRTPAGCSRAEQPPERAVARVRGAVQLVLERGARRASRRLSKARSSTFESDALSSMLPWRRTAGVLASFVAPLGENQRTARNVADRRNAGPQQWSRTKEGFQATGGKRENALSRSFWWRMDGWMDASERVPDEGLKALSGGWVRGGAGRCGRRPDAGSCAEWDTWSRCLGGGALPGGGLRDAAYSEPASERAGGVPCSGDESRARQCGPCAVAGQRPCRP